MAQTSNDDFEREIARAWADHADDVRGVTMRLPQLQALARDEPQLERVIGLARHVYGQHLGEWDRGAEALLALRTHPAYLQDAGSGQTLRRAIASLVVAGGGDVRGLDRADEIRVRAMAVDNLADHDTPRSVQLLREARTLADQAALPDADPAHRMIAIAGNVLACTLEEKAERSADERAAMIDAAQTARRYWERAGTWLEVERAEYRLAITWTRAGDAAQARIHAQNCHDIVTANQGEALERFFAAEALGVAARAAGDVRGHADALARARNEFEQLSAGDQGWCRAELDKLALPEDPALRSPAPG